MNCAFARTEDRHPEKGVVWRCVNCNAKAYNHPTKRQCDSGKPRPTSLWTLDCKYLTGIRDEEIMTGCCDGIPSVVAFGYCGLHGRCTLAGYDGTKSCLGCEDREAKTA